MNIYFSKKLLLNSKFKQQNKNRVSRNDLSLIDARVSHPAVTYLRLKHLSPVINTLLTIPPFIRQLNSMAIFHSTAPITNRLYQHSPHTQRYLLLISAPN